MKAANVFVYPTSQWEFTIAYPFVAFFLIEFCLALSLKKINFILQRLTDNYYKPILIDPVGLILVRRGPWCKMKPEHPEITHVSKGRSSKPFHKQPVSITWIQLDLQFSYKLSSDLINSQWLVYACTFCLPNNKKYTHGANTSRVKTYNW